MPPADDLRKTLASIDGRDYGTYQRIVGRYDYECFSLIVQQIPKDPYAPPHTGIYRVQVRRDDRRIIKLVTGSKTRRIACADYLARRFFEASRRICGKRQGTGFGGIITIDEPGQAILERSSVVITDEMVEIRCFVGLPADGRRILADIATHMLLQALPEIVGRTLLDRQADHQALDRHVAAAEDAEFLRSQLDALGLVAFIANDSILPRESGTSDKPMNTEVAVPFLAPPNLAQEITLPHAGAIKGMGIPKGITLITGGGYHGKSTLLSALETGIYNHIPDDGRERCVSNIRSVKVRAYSGRPVVGTDISAFIQNLPLQKDTTSFYSTNASGSTSQAATIMEAIESGAEVLFMDEDTCAANFIVRDQKMQRLVKKEDEPITPFIDRVRNLFEEKTISTVLVLGGVGDYFDVADHVIQVKNYQPMDVTEHAHAIAEQFPGERCNEGTPYPFKGQTRIPIAESLDPLNEYGKIRIIARDVHRLNYGRQEIDLTDLEQLMELSQTKAIGMAMEYAKVYMDGTTALPEIIKRVIADIDEKGLDVISRRISGHFAWFRGIELAFAFNRVRGLEIRCDRIGATRQSPLES